GPCWGSARAWRVRSGKSPCRPASAVARCTRISATRRLGSSSQRAAAAQGCLIEQVGGVEGVYRVDDKLPDNFLVRRTAGNAIEALGIVAFRASPVWVLAALADLSGMGRQLIPEIADALKAQGLLDKDSQFTSVDQMLDGLE